MNIIYSVLVAFPLGFFVASRGMAVISYLLAGSYLFSFQSTSVLLSWMSHSSPSAFGPFPKAFPVTYSNSEFFGYGAVNLVITVIGIGLVLLGHRVASRRRAKRGTVAVG